MLVLVSRQSCCIVSCYPSPRVLRRAPMRHLLILSVLSLTIVAAAQAAVAPVVPATLGAGPGGPMPIADSIVIEKKARRLTLYHQGRPLRSYLVALGAN